MPQMITNVLLNPARTRIVQYFFLHETGTAAQIGESLSDISKASLYRHLNKLVSCGALKVVRENKVRGTVEKVYAIGGTADNSDNSGDIRQTFYHALFTLLHDFEQYFKQEDIDPKRDMLGVTTALFMLSDEEFNRFSQELTDIYQKYLNNKPNAQRKLRRITLVSSPAATRSDKGE